MFLKGNISIGQTLLDFDFPEGTDGRVLNIKSVSFEVNEIFLKTYYVKHKFV